MITMKSPLLKHNAPGADIKPAQKKNTAGPGENSSPAVPEPAKNPNTNTLFWGLGLMVTAFAGVCVIFYFLNNSARDQEEKIKELIENVAHLRDEKNILEMEIQNLKAQGDSIKFDKLLTQAQGVYGQAEKNRKEGILWIDKGKKVWVVTLGALNGVARGSSIAIYDGDKKIGSVTVTMPLDVISYVQPQQLDQKFVHNHYHAVIE